MYAFHKLGCALAGVLLATGASISMAQDWPTRPVLAISPFTAGNAADIIGRVVLDQVSKQIGQPITVENRSGGGGTLGTAHVAKADPDGHTILIHASSFGAAVALHKTLPYDTLKDFAPVAMLGMQPLVLVTSPVTGYKTVEDLVKSARAKPGALNFASAGIGSISHLAAERFRHAAKMDVMHIPFRGPTEAFAEVVAGRVQFYFLPLAPALHLVSSGKVVALAVGADERAPEFPNVPTITEAGYPGATFHFWGGVFAPVKTSPAIVARLHGEIAKALQVETVRARLAKAAIRVVPMTAPEFARFFHDDVVATKKFAEEIGIKPN